MPQTSFATLPSALALITAFMLLISAAPLRAQDAGTTEPTRSVPRTPVRDEYSGMEEEQPKRSIRETLSLRIENTRQYYLQALGFLEKKDTLRAALSFESAISELSLLNSMNGVERYDEYTTMLQSLCDDYERYIRPAYRHTDAPTLQALRKKISVKSDRKPQRLNVQPMTKSSSKKSKTKPVTRTTVPLPVNEYVTRCIDFLVSDKGHKYFARWIDRTYQWFPLLKSIAREENVPEELVHIAQIESGLDPLSISHDARKGVGLWHCSALIADRYNLRTTPWVDERKDPVASTRACLRYLKDLHTELRDWHLAIAAYRGGIETVRAAMSKRSDTLGDFWSLRSNLPREVREYVPMYIAATLITMRYEDYGFGDWEMNQEPPIVTDTVTVAPATYLAVVARCAGVTTDSLRKLNPSLLSFSTPLDESCVIRIPRGTRSTFMQNLDESSEEEKLPWVLDTVDRNETLADVAMMTSTSVNDICALNDLSAPTVRLREGQILRIPKELIRRTRFASFGAEIVNDNVSPGDAAPPSQPVIQRSDSGSSDAGTPVEQYQRRHGRSGKSSRHTVRTGETLSSIAAMYTTSVSSIVKHNHLKSGAGLRRGQRLRIPVSRTPENRFAARSAERNEQRTVQTGAPPLAYKVRDNDSIVGICTTFNVTEHQLRAWNPDFVESDVKPDQVLTIYTDEVASGRGSQRATRSSGSATSMHTIRKGESLSTIARKYRVSLQALQSANGGATKIIVGKKLRIPR